MIQEIQKVTLFFNPINPLGQKYSSPVVDFFKIKFYLYRLKVVLKRGP
jgi:hypothetical protein